MHDAGVIHRDIKPSNVLLRRSNESPIALIDFGLSRFYVDKNTWQHLPQRQHPGFRGTAVYASPNAHIHQDLSRRDDLISWYYMALDLMVGPLPWRRIENRAEILHMKRKLSIGAMGGEIAKQFETIWGLISSLKYEERPNYERIMELLIEAKDEKGVSDTDNWDWHPQILFMGKSDDNLFLEQKQMARSSSSSELIFPDEIEAQRRYPNTISEEPLLSQVNEKSCDCCILL